MIAFIAVLSIALGYLATQVNFSFKFERFFSSEDEDVALFQKYKKGQYFSDSRTIVAVELPNGLFNTETLLNLEAATDSLKRTLWVKQTMALPDLQYFIESPMGMVGIPYVDASQPENFEEDSIRILKTESLYRVFVGKDFNSTLVNVFSEFYLNKADADSLKHSIHSVFNHYGFDKIHLGGRQINQSVIVDKLKSEMAIFVSNDVVIVIIVL